MLAQEFIDYFEDFCPLWLAEAGDPVGLHVGTLDKPVKKIMVTLDVRPEVVAEAIDKQVDLLIAKHPPIFRPIQRLTTDDPQNKMYQDLLKHDIAVYAAHTNMDIIPNGLNDWFLEELGLSNLGYLHQTHQVAMKKIAVFVPTEATKTIREALAAVGAGQLGNYQGASFSSTGVGRFTPQVGAHPTIGKLAQEEQVQESKLEMIFPETIEEKVVTTLLANHPYEEPAYDIYRLDNFTTTYGIGRVGELPTALAFEDFLSLVKQTFQLDGLRIVTPATPPKKIKRVAICGGSGEKFYPDALSKKADVYITGDVYYHTAHDMQTNGLTVIDPGHYIESLCKERLLQLFQTWQDKEDWSLEFFMSETSTNPFRFYN